MAEDETDALDDQSVQSRTQPLEGMYTPGQFPEHRGLVEPEELPEGSEPLRCLRFFFFGRVSCTEQSVEITYFTSPPSRATRLGSV